MTETVELAISSGDFGITAFGVICVVMAIVVAVIATFAGVADR